MDRESFLKAVAKKLGMNDLDSPDMVVMVDVTLKVAAEVLDDYYKDMSGGNVKWASSVLESLLPKESRP